MVDLIKYLNFKKYKLLFLEKRKNLGLFVSKRGKQNTLVNIAKRLHIFVLAKPEACYILWSEPYFCKMQMRSRMIRAFEIEEC
jgi:hypothetical protein